jgi:Leucine-rich repeat (LRR) protein
MQWHHQDREPWTSNKIEDAVRFSFQYSFHSYLHQNQIERIENLEGLQNLMTLNLSHNRIKNLEGLSCLPLLKNVDFSNNIIGANSDLDNPLSFIEELK